MRLLSSSFRNIFGDVSYKNGDLSDPSEPGEPLFSLFVSLDAGPVLACIDTHCIVIQRPMLRSQSGTVCDIGIMTLFYIFIST